MTPLEYSIDAGGYLTGHICEGCGEAQWWDLVEVWPEERAFLTDACCEWFSEELQLSLEEGLRMPLQERKAFFGLLRAVFEDHGIPFRSIVSDPSEGRAKIDWGLHVGDVAQAEAKAFVRKHHRHNPPPAGWRWGHGIFNGADLVGVVMVGRPVARAIDQTSVVEVNRLCLDHDSIPAGLLWNAASMGYGAAAREAKRRGFARIITYTLETEAGTTLKAAGWEATHTTKGGSWDTPSRRRTDKAPTCRKVRWERQLRKGKAA